MNDSRPETLSPGTRTSIDALLGRYQGLLLDAYGVLVDKQGALPGAAALIRRLEAERFPYLILTNSASRLPETHARELDGWGLPVPARRFVTSGMLLAPYFAAHGLQGAPSLVLGPEDSLAYVRRAGGEPVPLRADADAEVVVIADQKGFDTLEGMDAAASLLLRRLDAGRPLHLLLCNPDLVYPVAPGRIGFTAGGLAAMLDALLAQRYPRAGYRFLPLGKPHRPIFDEALRRLGTRSAAMLGDQPATDILGANRCAIDSVLVGTGLAHRVADPACRPTWFLASLLA